MNLRELITETEAWVREEISAQDRYVKIVEEQLEAVRTSDLPALDGAGEELERALRGAPERERRRKALIASYGRLWDVDPSILTLGSIAERLGPHGATLDHLRGELRERVATAIRLGRRLASGARQHRGVLQDVFRLLSGGELDPVHDGRGSLVNAEA